MRRLSWALAAVLLFHGLTLGGRPAQARSCVAPSMDAQTYAASAAVFVGRATGDRVPGAAERDRLEQAGLQSIEGDKIRLFALTVSRAWKGVEPGTSVTVARDTYWGDGFTPGSDYLVVAGGTAGEILIVGPCSTTRPLQHAGPQIEILDAIAP